LIAGRSSIAYVAAGLVCALTYVREQRQGDEAALQHSDMLRQLAEIAAERDEARARVKRLEQQRDEARAGDDSPRARVDELSQSLRAAQQQV
jgi:alkylation response protein AidB-like acyl-CoA dehydrogenase